MVTAVEKKGKHGCGHVRMARIPEASGEVLVPLVKRMIEAGSVVRTDGWKGYNGVEATAEALQARVRTTPFGDNAQVEPVGNGVAGWVCDSVAERGRRLIQLAREPDQRRRFGKEGHRRSAPIAAPEGTLNTLQAVLERTLTGHEPQLLTRQREPSMDFAATFAAREWTLSEQPRKHPVDYVGARLYDVWRRARTGARRVVRGAVP